MFLGLTAAFCVWIWYTVFTMIRPLLTTLDVALTAVK
jgi:hypothetical protein